MEMENSSTGSSLHEQELQQNQQVHLLKIQAKHTATAITFPGEKVLTTKASTI